MSCLHFALISSVLVCVVLHPFQKVCGIYQEFGFGLAPFRLGIWTGPCGVHCDFGDGLLSVPLELSGRKESQLRYEAVQHYGGVVWSVLARIWPIVAKPPNFSLACAHAVSTCPPMPMHLPHSINSSVFINPAAMSPPQCVNQATSTRQSRSFSAMIEQSSASSMPLHRATPVPKSNNSVKPHQCLKQAPAFESPIRLFSEQW